MSTPSYQKTWRAQNNAKCRAYKTKWRLANPEQNKEIQRLFRHKQKDALIFGYGGCCSCCADKTREFLTLDHTEGGGGGHRKTISNQYLQTLLVRAGCPSEFKGRRFRLLCMNCNLAKGSFGYCPHRLLPEDMVAA